MGIDAKTYEENKINNVHNKLKQYSEARMINQDFLLVEK